MNIALDVELIIRAVARSDDHYGSIFYAIIEIRTVGQDQMVSHRMGGIP
jgi:hypothetical protein